MHLVTLKARENGNSMTLTVAVSDAKDRESAGRLATYYAQDSGYRDATVTDSRRVTSGYVIVSEEDS